MSRLFSVPLFVLMMIVAVWIQQAPRVLYSAAPPTVDSVTAAVTSGGTESTFILIEAATAPIYVYGQITDTDGCADVVNSGTVTVKFYRTNHANGANCSVDNNDCYSIANAACTKTGCTGAGDNNFNYECVTPIWYYADATSSGPQSATNWTAKATATDAAQTSGSNNNTIEMGTLIALNITPNIIYGTVAFSSESAEQTFPVDNTGNSGIDVDLSVNGDMACNNGGSIPAGNVRYSETSGFSFESGTALSTTPTQYELNHSPRTNDLSANPKNVFFKLQMPAFGILPGSCNNILTAAAKADTGGGW